MTLSPRAREERDAIIKELESLGISDYRLVERAKSYAILFKRGEQEGQVAFAKTPSDVKAVQAGKSRARRLVRQMIEEAPAEAETTPMEPPAPALPPPPPPPPAPPVVETPPAPEPQVESVHIAAARRQVFAPVTALRLQRDLMAFAGSWLVIPQDSDQVFVLSDEQYTALSSSAPAPPPSVAPTTPATERVRRSTNPLLRGLGGTAGRVLAVALYLERFQSKHKFTSRDILNVSNEPNSGSVFASIPYLRKDDYISVVGPAPDSTKGLVYKLTDKGRTRASALGDIPFTDVGMKVPWRA